MQTRARDIAADARTVVVCRSVGDGAARRRKAYAMNDGPPPVGTTRVGGGGRIRAVFHASHVSRLFASLDQKTATARTSRPSFHFLHQVTRVGWTEPAEGTSALQTTDQIHDQTSRALLVCAALTRASVILAHASDPGVIG